MNREIKFRGKRFDNGEWVYGSLVQIDYHNSVDYVEATLIIMPNNHQFDVVPESVGECSGLKDKRKDEIFEGDFWRKGTYPYNLILVTFKKGKFNIADFTTEKGKIVGNLFENPELLEEINK